MTRIWSERDHLPLPLPATNDGNQAEVINHQNDNRYKPTKALEGQGTMGQPLLEPNEIS